MKKNVAELKSDELLQNKKPQGNRPGDDPKKFGLKFDGGKARWDLIPFKELKEIISVPESLMKSNLHHLLNEFNEHQIFNEIMEHIICYMEKNDPERLRLAGFFMFFLLRGKPYTKDELIQSCHTYRWDLFDINEIQKVVDVYTYGAVLYAPNNWRNVIKERYMSALLRHFKTVRSKERFDGESGFLHLHHAIWNVLSLLWLENNKTIKKAI